jgi:hypothetical protein
MAFKATVPISEQAFDRIRAVMRDTKRVLVDHRALMLVNPVQSTSPLTVIRQLAQALIEVDALAGTPGLGQYAKDQVNDPAYDIVAEYNSARGSMVSARDGLVSLFPKDANSFLLYQTYSASGLIQQRTFTPAQVSSAIPLIDAVIAAID